MKVDSDLLQRLSDEYSAMIESRHEMGAETYGPTKFLEVDTILMALEELADLGNYARYVYMKLRIMEEALRERGIDLSASLTEEAWGEDPIPPSPTPFVPSKEVFGFLPTKEQRG